MKYYLGIDLGTTNLKIVIIDETGCYIDSVVLGYQILSPHPGWAEQNPILWWEKTVEAINKLLKKTHISGKDIKGIGFSGQMHGMVPIAKDGKVLRNAIIWADQRTFKEVDYIKSALPLSVFKEKLGNFPNSGFTAPKILWYKKNEPHLYERTYKFLFPKDFLRYKITGGMNTEYSDASASLLFDLTKKDWSHEMLNILDIDIEKLPSISNSFEVIGETSKEFEHLSGIPKKTPVIAGGGDQPCTAIGNLITKKDQALITVGTGGQLFFPTESLKIDPQLRVHTLLHVIDIYYVLGAIQSAGASLKWWMDNITSEVSYKDIDNTEDFSKPGANGILFAPYLFGERTPYMDDKIRGTFIGISYVNKREDFIRSIMEGVSFAIRHAKEIILKLGITPKKYYLAGGITKNKLWTQILSDILNEELYILEGEEKAAYGAALLALFGIEGKDLDNVKLKMKSIVKPSQKNRILYDELFLVYKDIYKSQKELNYRLFSILNKIG